ncbi:MAG: hypothetical protein B6D61_00865 [Bacteroidetes bacterium 4484_249]|nr:MAG: hypothetical protein B6D61_00865 [Bacteroidetes bacterium 4484_249]
MKIRVFLIATLLTSFLSGFSQYLLNPSLEGTILMIGPPPEWEVCNYNSTPNVQPGKYGVTLPPSDGITYIGLLTRDYGSWEDIYSVLNTPLSQDSCYVFKIDLAYQSYLSFTTVDPIILRVFGSNVTCQKDNLLWQSPPISNVDWITYEFLIHNEEFDITDLLLEVYYVGNYYYWGYMLLDNIRITQTPSFELGNDTTLTLCSNDSLILDPGNGFTAYLWQDGSTEQTYVVDTTGLYWVQAFNEQGCSWTDSVYVTVEEYVEMVSEMIDSTLVCEGQEVVITANILNGAEPYSYEWLNLSDTTESVTIIADTTMFYYVLVTDHCGLTLIDSIKIVVVENPDIDLGNDTLICIDGSYTLDAGSGFFGYLWQDGSTNSTFELNQPGIYWVQVTSFMGCTSTDSIQIDLFPAIPLDIGNDTTLCEGETVTFNAGEGFVDYIWQDSSTDSTFTASTTGTYWVTVTDDNGCHATDSVFASFLTAPEINLGNDTSFCYGVDFYITPGPGFVSYLWQDNSTSEYYLVTDEGLYYVTVNNGCGEDSDSIYVNVDPSPVVNLGNDTTLCGNATLMLEPGTFDSYLWQDNSTYPFYNVTNTGVYSVEVTNNYGCATTDEIYVIISNPQVDLGDSTYICEGTSMILDAGEGFVSYEWQDGTTNQTYTADNAGNYWVTVIDNVGCEGNGIINIEMRYPPFYNPISDTGFCTGDNIMLYYPTGNYTIYWNGEQGDSTYFVTEQGTYSLSLANVCDSITDEIYIEEYPLPYVDLGEDQVIFPGDEIILEAGEGFDEYVWQDGSGQSYYVVTENNINAENPKYYVEVTEGICKSSDTVMVELFEVNVPDVITPNGDGKNDLFLPDLSKWAGIRKHEMIVFNRWGEKVWVSTDFESGWDGKRNGRYVSEGTYFWVLEVYYGQELTKQTLKGSLTVLGTEK